MSEIFVCKTSIKNLYLTSASIHSGDGVFAASGHNTAQVVLKDMTGDVKGVAITGMVKICLFSIVNTTAVKISRNLIFRGLRGKFQTE